MSLQPALSSDESQSKKRLSSSIVGISRSIAACQRCRSKKVRCDQNFPACLRCVKSGLECVGLDPATGREVPRSYVMHLENRVAELEGLLAGQEPPHVKRPHVKAEPLVSPIPSRVTTPLVPPNPSISFTRLMFTAINFNPQKTDPSTTSAPSAPPAPLPPKHIAREYLRIYFAQSNSQLPILHREQFLKRYWEPVYGHLGEVPLAADRGGGSVSLLAVVEEATWDFRLRNLVAEYEATHSGADALAIAAYIRTLPIPGTLSAPLFFLNIVFAIALSVLQLQTPAALLDRFRSAAIQHMDTVNNSPDRLESLQGVLLLSVYSIMRPAVPGVWYILGLALRLCVDLGLHTEQGNKRLSRFAGDMRRRLFWCTYSLDRQVCVYLGRPFGIPEECVTTLFPSELDDLQLFEEGTAPGTTVPEIPSYKTVALAMFKVRRIQAEIQRIMYEGAELPRVFPTLEAWRESILSKLQQWRVETPTTPQQMNCEFNVEYFYLNYNYALIMLHGLSPRSFCLTTNDYLIVAEAAKQVATSYHRLLGQQMINYTWSAVHNLFMAGASYLYSVYTCNELRQSVTLQELQTVTSMVVTVFHALRDRCDAAVSCRSTFEMLSAAIFKIKYGEVYGDQMVPDSGPCELLQNTVVTPAAHMGNAQLQILVRSFAAGPACLLPTPVVNGLEPDPNTLFLNGLFLAGEGLAAQTPVSFERSAKGTPHDFDRFFEELEQPSPVSNAYPSPYAHSKGEEETFQHAQPSVSSSFKPVARPLFPQSTPRTDPKNSRLETAPLGQRYPQTLEGQRLYEMIFQYPAESIWDQFFTGPREFPTDTGGPSGG